jgi:hypothetical protein
MGPELGFEKLEIGLIMRSSAYRSECAAPPIKRKNTTQVQHAPLAPEHCPCQLLKGKETTRAPGGASYVMQ